MTTRLSMIAAASGILFMSGCASLPNASVGYYQANTKAGFRVVRTVACDGNNNLVISNAATPTISHSADTGLRKEISLSKLKGTFSDGDVKLELYEDGRLKSFNATNTGEGETILKTVISMAASVFASTVEQNQLPWIVPR